jgi:phosphoribosyl-dephospho-CoA transferase
MLPRHTLVWPTLAGWTRVACDAADDAARRAFACWYARDWPLVVRRPAASEVIGPAQVALGLPLPPIQGKRRFRLRLATTDIARHAAPPALGQVVAALPEAWRSPVAALIRDAEAAELPFRVFGSVAWQWLTGLRCLHDASDLDLLCYPRSLADVDRALALLEDWECAYALRADGEIVFPDGAAVAWREWHSAPESYRVLVKQRDGVALLPRAELLRQLPAGSSS